MHGYFLLAKRKFASFTIEENHAINYTAWSFYSQKMIMVYIPSNYSCWYNSIWKKDLLLLRISNIQYYYVKMWNTEFSLLCFVAYFFAMQFSGRISDFNHLLKPLTHLYFDMTWVWWHQNNSTWQACFVFVYKISWTRLQSDCLLMRKSEEFFEEGLFAMT